MGSGNLLPHNIGTILQQLEKQGAEKIVILTDLDKEICITKKKARINARPQDIVVVAVKQIEACFLAATPSMRQLLQDDQFYFEQPEKEDNPFEVVRKLKLSCTGRGISNGTGGKINLVQILLGLGYSIQQSESHANANSAYYFLQKLRTLGN